MLGSATAASYAETLRALLADPHVDSALVLFVPAVSSTPAEVAEAVEAVARESGSGKPVLAVVMSSQGVPEALRAGSAAAAFAYPESAARALGRVADRAEWLRRPVGMLPQLTGVDHAAATAVVERALARAEDSWLEPAEARELLSAYGVPLVPERTAATANEAAAAAAELGYPVVVKSAIPGAHKTETGGVALDLADEAEVRAATERIGVPVIVQPMLRGGTELLAGLVQDPVFGPLVAFGPGGVFAELIGEVSLRIAPLTTLDAEEVVSEGKAGRLVRGFRGAPAADAPSLVDLVLRLSALGDEVPAVAELDLNPVLAFPDRCVAVDARIRVRRPETRRREKSW
jgi:acyl-CoA synthetase (NDP forming)